MATRGIYSLCGAPVRTVYKCRPDARCLRNEQTGRARPDDISLPSCRCLPLAFGRNLIPVWTTKLCPSGLQKKISSGQ